MVEDHWDGLRGRTLNHGDHSWELTGDVEVLESGDVVGLAAEQVDGVRHAKATLHFGLEDPPDSLNPGNLGTHFDRIERTGDDHHLVVKTEGRSYRYELQRVEYE